LFFAGRNEEAIDRLRKTLKIDPNFWVAHHALARVYIRLERFDEAIATLNIAKEHSDKSTEPVYQLGYAYAKAGRRAHALAKLEELKTFAEKNNVPNYNFAMVRNGLGETEEALNYLEKSFTAREVQLVFLKVDAHWDNLRSEPRFIEFMKRMNF